MSFNPSKYEIVYKYIKKGDARSGQKLDSFRFMVAHDVGVPNSRPMDNFLYFNNHQPLASAHCFIDDKIILVIVPLDEKAWHVRYDVPGDNERFGDDANDCAVGTELCYGPDIDFAKAYDRYVWFHAYMCNKGGLDPLTDIVSHAVLDPARRTDPDNALNKYGKKFSQFLQDVHEELEGGTPAKTPAVSDGSFPNQIIVKDTPELRKEGLHTYNSPDWNDKKGAPIIKTGEIFTVKKKVRVEGFPMYQLVSGWYVTASPEYVEAYKPAKKPAKAKTPSYVGKTVKAKEKGYRVNFYDRPTWDTKHKIGEITYDLGLRIIEKVKVDGYDQYKAQNSKGTIFYVTASTKYVRLV